MSKRTGTTKIVRTIIETTTVTYDQTPRTGPPSLNGRGAAEIIRLIDSGELKPGERLFWKRPRKGDTHYVTVNADGAVTPEGTDQRVSLAEATGIVSGISQNAWTAWRRERDGVRLDELRAGFDQG
ncbi:hypothetical protein [Nocardiopsis sp. YSL2]|uniref:restriction system modified-DNA reader domain-containing protein n=1 Tax=Nocardiopsis sp. YSL2 TaxID=2939492 RepID=UPI0026F40A6A|nr:hypothetical protein [Nocardiopsis sp. YSL2]